MAIDPLNQTLWIVAYGDIPAGKIPSKENVLNKAADQIIRTHQANDEMGKVFAALGSIVLILGLVLASVYAQSLKSNPTQWNVGLFKSGVITSVVGSGLGIMGLYLWINGHKRFEEDKTKLLADIPNAIGKDLAALYNERRDNENIFERAPVVKDAETLQNALAAFA